MKLLFIIITGLLLGFRLHAQHELVTVTYSVLFNQQFDQPGSKIRRLTARLLIYDASESRFLMVPDTVVASTENSINLDQDTVWRVRADLENQEMSFEDMFNSLMKPQWYADSLFPMRWRIDSSRKKIDSFTCVRATSLFRGREYIAWFCPELSLPFGPWKLGGLPGLILEVSDNAKNLMFRMQGIFSSNVPLLPAKNKTRPFREYLDEGKKIRSLITASSRTSDCLDCESNVKFRSWEKVFGD
jgi:GLPGLI family protein